MPSDVAQRVRFHLSVNVSDLDKSVQFFQTLFGTGPAKRRADYAKFELDDPPLVFSLEPNAPAGRGALNHAGFRFSDATTLVEAQRRLEMAGIHTQREEGVECCYARQTKFWVNDPDGGLWEFYVLEGDLDHRGEGQSLEQMIGTEASAALPAPRRPVEWEHRMGSPFDLPQGPCDEVRLRGTFNLPTSPDAIAGMLKRSLAALAPGGRICLHILTCEEELCEAPELPGPAAYVKYVPVRTDLMRALEEAGFQDLQLTTFRSGACFEFKGHPLRETKIEARRPRPASDGTCTVVFKGPFKEIVDDAGTRWRRGEATAVTRETWDALKRSSVADFFVELPAVAAVNHCGTWHRTEAPGTGVK